MKNSDAMSSVGEIINSKKFREAAAPPGLDFLIRRLQREAGRRETETSWSERESINKHIPMHYRQK